MGTLNKKKLGEAELEIMQVIWASESPVTSSYILKELQGRRKWQLSTLMTSLSRLADKGFVNCDRSGGSNLYAPLVPENEYKTQESKSLLDISRISALVKLPSFSGLWICNSRSARSPGR